MLSDGTANYIYGRDRLTSSAGTWYLGDALGSVRQTLDASGAVTAAASYDPWGAPQGSAIAPFGFTGEAQDDRGMAYLRARWYDPGSGTFPSRDPFAGWPEQPASLHYYQYAANDPVLLTDPSGQCYPPVAFLRDIEPGNCANLDQAIRIVQHPHATPTDKLLAGSYITAFVGSHLGVLVGAGVLTWEAALSGSAAVSTISAWGEANVVAVTSTGAVVTGGSVAGGLAGGGSQALPQAIAGLLFSA